MTRRRRLLLRIAIAVGVVAMLGLVASWFVGSQLIAPTPRVIDTLPEGLPAEEVVIQSKSGSAIHGWFVSHPSSKGTIVLLHGSRGDRRAMLGRMRFLHAAGYASLSIDFQAHGESPGDAITFGHREAHDARAAVEFAVQRSPDGPIGVIGESLGGAACLLGEPPPDADAFVFELVYPDLRQAITNRLAMFLGDGLGALATPLLTVQCDLRLGIDVAAMRPVDHIGSLQAPVFVLGGAADERTPAAETRRLFEAASDPKELWIVPDAIHRNLHTQAGAEYERRILAFLATALRR